MQKSSPKLLTTILKEKIGRTVVSKRASRIYGNVGEGK